MNKKKLNYSEKVNFDNYEFVWRVGGFDYFFTSHWLYQIPPIREFLVAKKGNDWKIYLSKNEKKNLGKMGLRQLEKGMNEFERTVQKVNKDSQIEFAQYELADLSKLKNEELADLFSRYIHTLRKLWDRYFYTQYFMHGLVQEKVEKEDINKKEYFAVSPKENIISKEYYERCKLALKSTEEAIKKHADKYSYIFYNDGGMTLTPKKLKQELKKIKNPKESIRKIENKHKQVIQQRKNHPLTKSVRQMAELKFLLRIFLNKSIFSDTNLSKKFLKEISKRKTIKNFSNYHYKEIIKLLKGKEISETDRSIFVLGKFSNWKPIIGKQANNIIDNFDSKFNKEIKELKGQIGNKGKFNGKVKIIPFDANVDLGKKIREMNKGDVLVSGSTGPEMIRACHKAGAIITEEGGICSHAAIVSRELKIPCIIGTKIATKLLKDGDEVEVDANKGVVKILKKK